MPLAPSKRPAVGWREWVALPDLGIPAIKAKVDTGARSSALHAFDVRERVEGGQTWLDFQVHPLQRDARVTVRARARLLGERWIRSSSGKETLRAVIESFVLREGTDYGERDASFDSKVADVMRQLERREAVIIYDPGSDSVDIARR